VKILKNHEGLRVRTQKLQHKSIFDDILILINLFLVAYNLFHDPNPKPHSVCSHGPSNATNADLCGSGSTTQGEYESLITVKNVHHFTFCLNNFSILDSVENEILDLGGQLADVHSPLLRHAALDGGQRGTLPRIFPQCPAGRQSIKYAPGLGSVSNQLITNQQ
jgi:hypothetical protein